MGFSEFIAFELFCSFLAGLFCMSEGHNASKAGKKPKNQKDEAVAANSVAGGGVDLSPTVRMKKGRKFATFNVSDDVLKKFKSGKKKYSKWKEYLNMEIIIAIFVLLWIAGQS